MYKIIGGDQKEYGPVSVEQVLEWIKEGRANDGTLVQSEESDEWKPLSEYPEFSSALPGNSAAASPVERLYPPQVRGQSPVQPRSSSAGEPYVYYDFRILDCYSRSWELFKSNWSLFISSTLLAMVLVIGIGFVPILGFFASIILAGPLYGGFYMLYLKAIRGEPVQVQDMFEGFTKAFVPLMLGGVVPNLLIMLSCVLCFVAVPLMAMRMVTEEVGLFLVFVGVLPALYLGICWNFTLPLIIDRGLDFIPAMRISRRAISPRWFKMFALVILGALLNLIGIFFAVIGLLVTIPVFFGALMFAYEDIFNGPQRSTF